MAMFKRVSATALDVSGPREAPKVGPHRLRSQANRGSRCQSAITCKLAEIMGFFNYQRALADSNLEPSRNQFT